MGRLPAAGGKRVHMRYFRRLTVALMVPAAIFTTVALTAGTASAGTVPGVPSQQQMARHHHLRHEFFTIKIVNHGNENNAGVVQAFGPVNGSALDTELSNTQAVFDFGDDTTVNVLHSDVSNVQPAVDLRSCTATADATGHWLFDGGTGRYQNAFGFGAFKFHLFVQFRKHHHHCRVNMHTQPKLTVIDVTAWGRATAGHRHDQR
jgi:hypothetical protein